MGEEYNHSPYVGLYIKFDNKSRAFRDWSISLGGGAFMQRVWLLSRFKSYLQGIMPI